MNILFLINYAGKGGSEKYVEILSEYLLKDKNNKVFFIYNESGNLVENMKKLNINPVQINMKNIFDFKASKYIADFCKKNNIHIIHTQFPRENYIALHVKKIYKKIKVLYTSHINIENNFIWKAMNKLVTKNNDKIISVCTQNKNLLIKNGYPKNKIQIIFNGVKYKNYIHNNKNGTIRKEFNLSNEFIFVTITRFTEEKGTEFLIKSVYDFKNFGNKNFKILIVGDGPLENKLKSLTKELNLENEIFFLGYRNDIENILQGSDCFINSSRSEALSFGILEALSNALPVIATNVGGNSDIINNKTNSGILVEYNNYYEMAKAMKKIMIDKKIYEEKSNNATKSIEEIFNIEKILEQTNFVYKNLTKKENFKND